MFQVSFYSLGSDSGAVSCTVRIYKIEDSGDADKPSKRTMCGGVVAINLCYTGTEITGDLTVDGMAYETWVPDFILDYPLVTVEQLSGS